MMESGDCFFFELTLCFFWIKKNAEIHFAEVCVCVCFPSCSKSSCHPRERRRVLLHEKGMANGPPSWKVMEARGIPRATRRSGTRLRITSSSTSRPFFSVNSSTNPLGFVDAHIKACHLDDYKLKFKQSATSSNVSRPSAVLDTAARAHWIGSSTSVAGSALSLRIRLTLLSRSVTSLPWCKCVSLFSVG